MPADLSLATDALADAFFVDECVIYEARNRSAPLDRSTGRLTAVEPVQLYEGPCHIQHMQGRKHAEGEEPKVTDQHLVRLRPCPGIRPGMVVRLRRSEQTEFHDFKVLSVPVSSHTITTHLIVSRVTAMPTTAAP